MLKFKNFDFLKNIVFLIRYNYFETSQRVLHIFFAKYVSFR